MTTGNFTKTIRKLQPCPHSAWPGYLPQSQRLAGSSTKTRGTMPQACLLRKLGCLRVPPRNQIIYSEKLKGNVGRPVTRETPFSQEISLNWNLCLSQRLSFLVRKLWLKPFSALVSRICYISFESQTYQIF